MHAHDSLLFPFIQSNIALPILIPRSAQHIALRDGGRQKKIPPLSSSQVWVPQIFTTIEGEKNKRKKIENIPALFVIQNALKLRHLLPVEGN